MNHHHRRYLALLGAALAIGAPIAVRSEDGRQPAAKEWATVNGDLSNTRYSTLTQIDPQTVGRLAGAWTSAAFDAPGAGRAMPVVRDGLLFITAGSRINAYDARTGATVWSHATDTPPTSAALGEYNRSTRGLPNREGVAVGDGLVFAGLTNSRVIALREKTGGVAWDVFVGIEPARAGQGVSGAPVYANGLVIVGTAGDTGFRGKVVALEAQSGRKAWEWFAVAGAGDPGYKTWPKDTDAWKTGGGAVWLVGAADLDLGLVYFGTGNGVPQYAGDTRAGDNLYLCSVVALDIKTGKLRWHYQTIRHDIWEADIAESPVLFEAPIGGRVRKGIAAMRTDGYLFMLDRETGKPLMAMEERKVRQDARSHTVSTQPYPVGADPVLPDCGEWRKQPMPSGFELGCFFAPASLDTPNLLTPAWGMRVVPMAFSPQTGYFYAIGNSSLQWFRRAEDPYIFILGAGKVPGLPQGHAVMAAIDSRTNKIAWKQDFQGGRPAGALATAGGLLFQMMPDGNLVARDARTGATAWQFQTGQAGGGPAASYEIDGEQYLAVGLRNNVMAFKLGGALAPVAAPAPAPRPATAPLFTGQIQDVNRIEIVSNIRDNSSGGARFMTDEYAFSVYRARVKVGTQVLWVNNGQMRHTVMAEDGSWTTGPLAPLEAGAVVFDKPGTHRYVCKDHPWAKAELTVVP
ncbi:MAG: PQQ-binding-like beta-propeller repeat protein [Acidobacteriota bacterium]